MQAPKYKINQIVRYRGGLVRITEQVLMPELRLKNVVTGEKRLQPATWAYRVNDIDRLLVEARLEALP